MNRSRKEEIMYWYNEILEQEKSGMGAKKYCESKGIEFKRFTYMKYRLMFSCKRDKEVYDKYVEHARRLQDSGLPIGQFCKEYKVDHHRLKEMETHLRYKEVVDEYKQPTEKPKMNFIQIPTVRGALARPSIEAETEVVKKQNDVELIISAGVKVVVAPEVGADKLIRIIELLKDL